MIKKILTFFAISALLCSVVFAQPTYNNPIIPGFNPDPAICRVGDDFYLVTSTFEYFPGVPIYHSKDLVNWKMIGHALHRPSQLNLDNLKCSQGIFAPTLRYHNGTFYMITTLVGGNSDKGNFIVTATNPEGPWSEPHWIEDAPGIDPSLFFDDDGKVYYCGNVHPENEVYDKHRNIWLQELDVNEWKLTGPRVHILDGSEYYNKNTLDGGFVNGMHAYEAPHIYKKDGRYYLIIAHGGTGQLHAVSIWNSDLIFGPYKSCPRNPILTHRDMSGSFPITCTGHLDFTQVKDNKWVAVYLARRPFGGSGNIMGRETFMTPVDWSGEWPVINPDGYVGRSEMTHQRPNLAEVKITDGFPVRDEFDGLKLRPEWTFIRTPRSEWWSLDKRKGALSIQLRPERISDQTNPSFIGIRQQHIQFTSSLKMEFTPGTNEDAGYIIERDKDHYFRFVVDCKDGKTAVSLYLKDGESSDETIINSSLTTSSTTYLRVVHDNLYYTFSYSFDGKSWGDLKSNVDGRWLGSINSGRFTGTFIGMYASSNGKQSDNVAHFDWFEYKY